MLRAIMLREQARLLRDIANAGDESPLIRERLQRLADQCEELAREMERSPDRRR